tara:strand:- start:607 stop:1581 length:975 start_codon:yes stop_codon:yes gene_type:complete
MYKPIAEQRPDRYKVSVDEYKQYQAEGYLRVEGLVALDEVEELKNRAMAILTGEVEVPGVEPPSLEADGEAVGKRFVRVHMLHRNDFMSERFLLHPRILDVVEVLVGPDVLALQTMQFFNQPGSGGQGWHQDSYYITTYPDTLIGTWLALDRADEENGCLWVLPGSNHEPIYPGAGVGHPVHAEGAFAQIETVENISHLDDEVNTLSAIARRYGDPVPVVVDPGDVVFFHPHLLHRSHPNRAEERWRRAFVSHYCNARSWVPWNHGAPYEGEAANYLHILARGTTHLPFAQPQFGTPCAAQKAEAGGGARRMVAVGGDMEPEGG